MFAALTVLVVASIVALLDFALVTALLIFRRPGHWLACFVFNGAALMGWMAVRLISEISGNRLMIFRGTLLLFWMLVAAAFFSALVSFRGSLRLCVVSLLFLLVVGFNIAAPMRITKFP
jgi:hypothetical protein